MIIDGKAIADEILENIRKKVMNLKGRPPCLAVLMVGTHSASKIYITRKIQACERVGIQSIVKNLPENISQAKVLEEITLFNQDNRIDGILIQLPLPGHMFADQIIQAINPDKDVDGFHPINVGKMLIGATDGFFSCTPLGILVMLEKCNIDLLGKQALIIGRSNIVGKPMAALLMQNTSMGNATVTIANRYTKNLKQLGLMSDLIIAATGQPRLVKADMVKEGAIVIDVGINKIDNASTATGYQIVGDVDFENVKDKCSFITPVPGGVGPMTIAMLLSNTFLSYQRRTL